MWWFLTEKMAHNVLAFYPMSPSFFPNGGMDIQYVQVKYLSSINEKQCNKTLIWKHLSELHDLTKLSSSHEGLRATPGPMHTHHHRHMKGLSHLIQHGKSHSDIWNVIYIVYITNRISLMHLSDWRVTPQQHSGKKFQLGLKHSYYIHMNNWTCFATFSILSFKLSHCWLVVITLCLH